jgi:hypothetical protein
MPKFRTPGANPPLPNISSRYAPVNCIFLLSPSLPPLAHLQTSISAFLLLFLSFDSEVLPLDSWILRWFYSLSWSYSVILVSTFTVISCTYFATGISFCGISGFLRDVHEICALLGYHTAYNGNYLPTFRVNLSAPSSRVNKLILFLLIFINSKF